MNEGKGGKLFSLYDISRGKNQLKGYFIASQTHDQSDKAMTIT